MVKLVPATADHVRAIYGAGLPVTVIGIAGVDGDEVLGFGAIYVQEGCWILVCQIAKSARARLPRHAKSMVAAARALLAVAAKSRLPVRTVVDRRYPRAVELIEHLGFRRIEKDIYECPASN